MIESILFDLDDLMVNSAHIHQEASRRIFLEFGVDTTTLPHDVISSYFGKRVIEILHILVDHYGLTGKVDVKKLDEERQTIFLELIEKELEPMPGLFELIDTIRPTSFKRAMASSGTKKYINAVINKFSLGDFFQAVVSGDMVRNGKPSPDVFLMAAKLLDSEPAKCLVLEDSTCGALAAKTAGMYCIGVENSLSPYKQDLSQCDVIVKRLDQIDLPLLNRISPLVSRKT